MVGGISMKLIKENYIYKFSRSNKAIGSVELGETFQVETLDCYGGRIKTEKDLRSDIPNLKVNPATGPVYVEGIKKGDAISITIENIELNSYGVMVTESGMGVLGDHINESQTKILPLEKDYAILNEKIKIPINKMIGVIGVAPSEAVPTSTPGDHGGNMDTKDINNGSTLYLPSFTDGGLLALGDMHAAMGDGELDGTGIETGGKVTLKVNKHDQLSIQSPIIENENYFLFVASSVDIHEAIRKGMLEAISFLQKVHNVEFADAYRLVSAKGNLRISQLVNPKVTIRIELPKTIIPFL